MYNTLNNDKDSLFEVSRPFEVLVLRYFGIAYLTFTVGTLLTLAGRIDIDAFAVLMGTFHFGVVLLWLKTLIEDMEGFRDFFREAVRLPVLSHVIFLIFFFSLAFKHKYKES